VPGLDARSAVLDDPSITVSPAAWTFLLWRAMQRLVTAVFATMCASVPAQSPLATLTGGTNQGNIGGAVYFDLTVTSTVFVTRIDFLCGSSTFAGTGLIDVHLGPPTYVGNTNNPAAWTLAGSATAAVAPGTVASGTLVTPLVLGPGSFGVALVSNGHNFGYTNGVACTNTTTPGACSNSTFSTAELTLRAGAAQNQFLSGSAFTPRVFNGAIHYIIPSSMSASQTRYGAGCYFFATSFFEPVPSAAGIDLATTTVDLGFNGVGYDAVTPGTNAFTPPVGATNAVLASGGTTFLASSVLGAPLPFAFRYPSGGGVGIANDLEIGTDGFLTPVPFSNPPDETPTPAEFLAGAPRWAPYWKNVDPFAAGSISLGVEAATGAFVVSWNGVADPQGQTALTSSFQVAFFPSGSVQYRYGSLSVAGGTAFPLVIGWTQGGGALRRDVDVSAGGFSTQQFDNAPLDLFLTAPPRIGTNPSMIVQGYSPATPLGATLVSMTQFAPGIPLAAMGMPGCFQHAGADIVDIFATTPGSTTVPFVAGGIPNLVALIGFTMFGQAVTFTPGFNPAGIIASNGVRLFIGL
jgi:hypothetical protein